MTQNTASVTVDIEELVRVVLKNIAGQHSHQWAVIAVTYPEPPDRPVHPRMAMFDDATHVLIKCACGEPRSVMLDGKWTEEQIKTEVPVGNSNDSTRSPSGPERDDGPSGEYPPG